MAEPSLAVIRVADRLTPERVLARQTGIGAAHVLEGDRQRVLLTMSITPTSDPLELFQAWFEAAREREPAEPNAMGLATVDPSGQPSVRMVLLKGVDARGFVFYTNYESQKGR